MNALVGQRRALTVTLDLCPGPGCCEGPGGGITGKDPKDKGLFWGILGGEWVQGTETQPKRLKWKMGADRYGPARGVSELGTGRPWEAHRSHF